MWSRLFIAAISNDGRCARSLGYSVWTKTHGSPKRKVSILFNRLARERNPRRSLPTIVGPLPKGIRATAHACGLHLLGRHERPLRRLTNAPQRLASARELSTPPLNAWLRIR